MGGGVGGWGDCRLSFGFLAGGDGGGGWYWDKYFERLEGIEDIEPVKQ